MPSRVVGFAQPPSNQPNREESAAAACFSVVKRDRDDLQKRRRASFPRALCSVIPIPPSYLPRFPKTLLLHLSLITSLCKWSNKQLATTAKRIVVKTEKSASTAAEELVKDCVFPHRTPVLAAPAKGNSGSAGSVPETDAAERGRHRPRWFVGL